MDMKNQMIGKHHSHHMVDVGLVKHGKDMLLGLGVYVVVRQYHTEQEVRKP